ncbi:MAG: TIGR00730 family Rossman fold protein [Vicinamibacteria bacterium]
MIIHAVLLKSICVYCGSASGTNPAYAVAAREMGRLLATSDRVVVYGGGGIGLMGEVARSAMDAGGKVIGVIPTHLNTRERAYDAVDLRVVSSMHERKQTMADLADAFVALPGGLGTFDELFEILTWAQIGLHGKPVGVLNVAGYFDALLSMIDLAVREGFAPAATRARIVAANTPAALIDALEHAARSSA